MHLLYLDPKTGRTLIVIEAAIGVILIASIALYLSSGGPAAGRSRGGSTSQPSLQPGISHRGQIQTQPPPSPPPEAPSPPSPPPQPTPELTWKHVFDLEGDRGLDTVSEPFLVTGDGWRVNWSMEGGRFSVLHINIYRVEGERAILYNAISVGSPGSGAHYIREPGIYFLDVTSADCEWRLSVEEELPADREPVGSILADAEWVHLGHWSGSEDEITEEFETPTVWRVRWRATPSNQFSAFSIRVVDSRGHPVYLLSVDSGSGTFYVYGATESAYLDVSCADLAGWEVDVDVLGEGG